MGEQLKLRSMVRVRVSHLLKRQLLNWATRAGLSYSDFVRMSLVMGARQFALRHKLYHPEDDAELEDVQLYHFRGPARSANNGRVLPPLFDGRVPDDAAMARSEASRKARLEQK